MDRNHEQGAVCRWIEIMNKELYVGPNDVHYSI